jgi:hypothetical protein
VVAGAGERLIFLLMGFATKTQRQEVAQKKASALSDVFVGQINKPPAEFYFSPFVFLCALRP